MHKPLTLLQRLAERAEASDCDCQTDDADLINEAIAEIEALRRFLIDRENERNRFCSEFIDLKCKISYIKEELAATYEDLIDHTGDDLDDARAKRVAALKGEPA